MGFPFGSSMGQSSRLSPARPAGLAAAHGDEQMAGGGEIVGERVGVARARSMPTSRMTATTSGWTWFAGSVPAEAARTFAESASVLKKAAAIWERPALWTHAKITCVLHGHVLAPFALEWCQPCEERGGRRRANELGADETGDVDGPDAREGVAERSRTVTAGFAERRRGGEQ